MPAAVAGIPAAVGALGGAVLSSRSSGKAAKLSADYNNRALTAQQQSETEERAYRAEQDKYQRTRDARADAMAAAEEARRQRKADIISSLLGGGRVPAGAYGGGGGGASGGYPASSAGFAPVDPGMGGMAATDSAGLPGIEPDFADFFRRRRDGIFEE